jgi:hypothetical protein
MKAQISVLAMMISLLVTGCDETALQPLALAQTPPVNAQITDARQPLSLEILTQTGPWPVASRLIGYNGRLWFANSVKGVNHNAADIWSIDLISGKKRYERSLFSQDAGLPLVYNGLLYWPFEDALLSFGNGIIGVTDGENWSRMVIPGTPIYHSYEAINWRGHLLALAAAGDTALHRYLGHDGGPDLNNAQWQSIVRHTAPRGKIARLKELTHFNGAVYAVLRDGKKRRLARWSGEDGARFEDVLPWPRYKYLNGLTVHKGALYALVGRGAAREIWRHDGQTSYRVGPSGRFADLASDGDTLWLAGFDGQLLSSIDGSDWQRHKRLEGGRPITLNIIDGGLFAAGRGDDGRGIIWWQKGHALHPATPRDDRAQQWAEGLTAKAPSNADIDWQAKGAAIDRLLADPQTFISYRGGPLGDALKFALENNAPQGFFADRLRADIADSAYQGFGSGAQTGTADLAQMLILSAMAEARHSQVPHALILKPWRSKANSYEKYIEPSMAAIHAAGRAQQGDKATVAALLKRLDYKDDPDWLRSQIIGALTAATGQHFGYDIAAWQRWNDAR